MKIVLALIILTLTTHCTSSSDGTSTGNPLVAVKFKAYNSTMALSQLKFCFKRIRFKMSGESTNADPTQDSDNLDFYLGEVSISSLGTNLEDISLPSGTYSRVELDLEDKCPSGKSVQLTNSNGSFSTDDRITIKFEGTFVHTSANQTLELGIQQITSALNTVTSDSNIRNKAESVSGDF